MSATTLDFLTALGIDAQATERDVRRAYARQLKSIDHETDVDAFHALREDYLAALQWIAERDRQGVRQDPEPRRDIDVANTADVPAAGTPQAEVVDAIEASDDPGQAVFDEFNAKLATEIDSEKAAEAALTAALRDPRLASIDAPAHFEARVAVLLANGWQPGHQFLFLPAIRVFGWKQDFRRLDALGALGEFVHAAILQRDYFFTLDNKVFDVYAELIQRLRDDQDPTRRRLIEDMPKLRILRAQFPEWLQMVTSMRNVDRWDELFDQLPESKRRPSDGSPIASLQAPTPQQRRTRAWSGWIWLFVLSLPMMKSCIDDLTR